MGDLIDTVVPKVRAAIAAAQRRGDRDLALLLGGDVTTVLQQYGRLRAFEIAVRAAVADPARSPALDEVVDAITDLDAARRGGDGRE